MPSLPHTWPEATLALALVTLVSYLVADVVARLVQSVLRAVIEDDELEALLVDRPRRLVRLARRWRLARPWPDTVMLICQLCKSGRQRIR